MQIQQHDYIKRIPMKQTNSVTSQMNYDPFLQILTYKTYLRKPISPLLLYASQVFNIPRFFSCTVYWSNTQSQCFNVTAGLILQDSKSLCWTLSGTSGSCKFTYRSSPMIC